MIVALVSGNSFSIVMEGRSGRYFPINRGLGEGTGISPALFIFFFEFLRFRIDSSRIDFSRTRADLQCISNAIDSFCAE
jgi:hypothetical protein